MKTHRDRVCGPSGRRGVAGDALHRQNFPTPSDGPHTRPERRLIEAFGPFGVWADGVAHGSRCNASPASRSRTEGRPRRTLLAENLDKPSL